MSARPTFSAGIGRWIGTAEVYDGAGHFLGNATDRRHVQRDEGNGRIRIDLSFIGPFKFAGHYVIEPGDGYRLYRGPANTGYAETLAENLVDAEAYWPITGLSQSFFLMILPGGDRQVSLALMSRGAHLLYAVVGEYRRVPNDGDTAIPDLVNGTSFDLHDDPAAGRGDILLHRPGTWSGNLTILDDDLNPDSTSAYTEAVGATSDGLQTHVSGTGFDPAPQTIDLHTNGWQAWSGPGPVTGSYSMSGGRALSGTFHHLDQQVHVWRREVVAHDGSHKAVLHTWYRGRQRVGVAFGVLAFSGDR